MGDNGSLPLGPDRIKEIVDFISENSTPIGVFITLTETRKIIRELLEDREVYRSGFRQVKSFAKRLHQSGNVEKDVARIFKVAKNHLGDK